MLALGIHVAIMLAALVGVVVRARWHATLAFVVFLLVGLVNNVLKLSGALGRENWIAWLALDVAQGVLAVGVAIEIAVRMFHRRLPGARVWTERILLLVLGLGCAAAVAWGLRLGAVGTDAEFYRALIEAERRLAVTSLWLFVALFWLALVHLRWPVDAYHRDVALGFVVYQIALLLGSPQGLLSALLPPSWPVWVYGVVLVLWLRAAWRAPDLARVAPRWRALVWPWLKEPSDRGDVDRESRQRSRRPWRCAPGDVRIALAGLPG